MFFANDLVSQACLHPLWVPCHAAPAWPCNPHAGQGSDQNITGVTGWWLHHAAPMFFNQIWDDDPQWNSMALSSKHQSDNLKFPTCANWAKCIQMPLTCHYTTSHQHPMKIPQVFELSGGRLRFHDALHLAVLACRHASPDRHGATSHKEGRAWQGMAASVVWVCVCACARARGKYQQGDQNHQNRWTGFSSP